MGVSPYQGLKVFIFIFLDMDYIVILCLFCFTCLHCSTMLIQVTKPLASPNEISCGFLISKIHDMSLAYNHHEIPGDDII